MMTISRIACSLCFTMISVSAADLSQDLPVLTPVIFAGILKQVVFPQDYEGLTSSQARKINQPQDAYFTYRRNTEKDFLTELVQKYNIRLPKPFSCNENFNIRVKSQNGTQDIIYNGLLNICAKDYDFNLTLYVFDDPNISAKKVYQNDKFTILPNVIEPIGFLDADAYIQRRKDLTGIVKCHWVKGDKQPQLAIRSLNVYPYQLKTRQLAFRQLFSAEGLSMDLEFKGIYETDFNNRADRIYDTLCYVARDILGASNIVVKKEAIHPVVLKNLTTPTSKEVVFKERIINKIGTGIYELRLSDDGDNEESLTNSAISID